MSILVMCLLFFISCEKIDSFIEKNSVDTEEQMESTEGTISDISSDISNDIENEIKNNKHITNIDITFPLLLIITPPIKLLTYIIFYGKYILINTYFTTA